MRKLLVAALAFSLISGCTRVGNDYVRPEITTPRAWTVSYETAAGLADTAWWREFNEPVLDELIGTAIANNLDLQRAAARVDQLLGLWRTTRSEVFPQVGGGATLSRQDDTDTGLSPGRDAYSFYQGVLNLNWELDFWGRLARRTEAARADVLATEAGRRAVLLTLVSSVAGGYLQLRGLDRQLEIARETEQAYAHSLKIFRLRHTHGTVSELEVSQVESEYENARQAIPTIEIQIGRQEHLLSLLLGQNPGAIPRGKPFDALSLIAIPAGLPSSLLEQRPDIIAAEQELIAANARIGVARSLYYPTISLTGGMGLSTIHSDKLFDSDSAFWQMGGNLLAPIFTFGSIEGQVMAAEAAGREALLGYRQAILSAFREVEDALTTTVKGRETLDAKGRRVKALKRYARLAWDQYDAGTTNYLSVLDANRSLFSAQIDYERTRAELFTSLVDVYRSMGGGWLDAADRQAASDIDISVMEEKEVPWR